MSNPTEEQNEEARWAAIQRDIAYIKSAVVGDEAIGMTGLVKRVDRLETKMRTMDIRMAFGAGAGFILGTVIKYVLKL